MSKSEVIRLYKTLLYMGREYPAGYTWFRDRVHRAFLKNRDVTDRAQIEKLLTHGNYIVKEITALYSLKKYRTLKRRYYKDHEDPDKLLMQLANKPLPSPESSK